MKNLKLRIEFAILFYGTPMLLVFDLLPGHKIIWLNIAALGCLYWLSSTSASSCVSIFHFTGRAIRVRDMLQRLLLRSAIVCTLLTCLMLEMHPDWLFSFPRQRPLLWMLVVILYPMLSVFQQELIYRKFFFRRYASIFPTDTAMVLASGISFAWLHVVYNNLPSLILSLIGGLVFAQSYRKSGSLLWTSIEHAVYGVLVFSIGFGRYFYSGPH